MTSSGRRANGWRQDDDPCLRWRVTAVVRVCAFMTLMLVTSATALPPTWSKPYGHGRDKQLQLGMPQASQPANRCSLSCPEGSRSPSKAAVCSWGTLLVLGRTNGGCSSSRNVVHGIAAHLKSAANLTPEPLCHEPHTHTACSPFDGLPLCAESADKPAKDRERFVLCHTPQLLPPQPPATRFEQHLRKLLPPCQNTSAWQWMACANTQAENTTCRDRYTLCASRPIGRRVQAQVPSRTATGLTQQLAHGKRQLMNRPAPLSPAPHATGKQIKLLLGQPPPKPPSSHPIRPHPAKWHNQFHPRRMKLIQNTKEIHWVHSFQRSQTKDIYASVPCTNVTGILKQLLRGREGRGSSHRTRRWAAGPGNTGTAVRNIPLENSRVGELTPRAC